MKKVLLAAILLASANAFGQSLEVGIGGGFSTNTAPDGNMIYKQDQSLLNYAGTLKAVYTTHNYWQLGLDGHVMEIAGKSNERLVGVLTDSVGGDNRKLVYAKYGISICGVANKAFTFYNKQTNKWSKSYVYLGVALGYGSARNNHIEYNTAETYKAPDGGRGLVVGGQVGYVGNLSERFAFNLDIAIRHIDLKYDAGAPLVTPLEDLHYSVVAVPVTFGLRYFLFRTDKDLIPRSGGARPMGRSSY